MSGGTVLYTPPTGYVLDVKHIIIGFTGDATCVVNIYDDTGGTADEVMAFNYQFNADDNQNQTIHLKDLDGFYFGKAFRVVATSSKVNIAVSGILK